MVGDAGILHFVYGMSLYANADDNGDDGGCDVNDDARRSLLLVIDVLWGHRGLASSNGIAEPPEGGSQSPSYMSFTRLSHDFT